MMVWVIVCLYHACPKAKGSRGLTIWFCIVLLYRSNFASAFLQQCKSIFVTYTFLQYFKRCCISHYENQQLVWWKDKQNHHRFTVSSIKTGSTVYWVHTTVFVGGFQITRMARGRLIPPPHWSNKPRKLCCWMITSCVTGFWRCPG